MDAGSFVIALLTAAGAAAGPAALGAPPDDTAATARCIAAPEEELSGSARSGTDVGSPSLTREQLEEIIDIVGPDSERDTGQQSRSGSSALAEELAQELADIVADSDDPTSQRLAAALADAGFEPSATGGSRQETAASRSDDEGRGDRSNRSDERSSDQRGSDQRSSDDDRLGQRDEQAGDRRGDNRQRDNRQRDDQRGSGQDDASACDEQDTGQATERDTGTNRSSDLEDVLSRRSDRDQGGSDRSGSRAGRDDSGIAAALERGERTAE